VVTRYGYAEKCERIEIVEAAHPVPDAAGFEAAKRLKEIVSGLTSDDLVVALISGGGSALLPAPAEGLTLEDEQAINRALLASGAPIGVMNLIRNQFSTIKGGRLAALAAPARVATLVVSDVPGDDPALVASGPTISLAGTRADARKFAELYRLDLPEAAKRLLASEDNPAPRSDDPRFVGNSVVTIASAALSLTAAAEEARKRRIPSRARRGMWRWCMQRLPRRFRKGTSRSRSRWFCCPAARRRLRCAARVVAGGTGSFFWRSPSRLMASRG
jgi:hydroxypyruvate reductase